MASDPPNPNVEIPQTDPVNVLENIPTTETQVSATVPASETTETDIPEIAATVPESPTTETEVSATAPEIPLAEPEITAAATQIPLTGTGISASEITKGKEEVNDKESEDGSPLRLVKADAELLKGLSKVALLTDEASKQLLGESEDSDQNKSDNVSEDEKWSTDSDIEEGDNDSDDDWGIELRPMCVLTYVTENNMRIGLQDVLSSLNIFPYRYSDWNALALPVLHFWRLVNPGNNNHPAPDDVTPGNCWPGSVTIFGNISVANQKACFQRLNWIDNDFKDVKHMINCLVVIKI